MENEDLKVVFLIVLIFCICGFITGEIAGLYL